MVRCAARQGIKTALHEQNAFPGVTNKLLAPDVDIVFAAVPAAVEKLGAPEKTIVVGNPVRPEVFTQAKNREAIRAELGAVDRTVILSFGGSLGARRVNEVVADLCAWEQKNHKPVLHLHATGQYGVQLFQDLEKKKGFAPGESLVVKEYINNMPELLAAADLVISRAGALTLAELEAVGRAAVLIPSPNVAENHQYYNAMELQKAGAAVVIEEKDLTGEKLVPVSYTHLDVYKRQALTGGTAAAADAAAHRLCADVQDLGLDAAGVQLPGDQGQGGIGAALLVGAAVDEQDFHKPVSYTHLDVYKRQVRHRVPVHAVAPALYALVLYALCLRHL